MHTVTLTCAYYITSLQFSIQNLHGVAIGDENEMPMETSVLEVHAIICRVYELIYVWELGLLYNF